MNSDVRARLRGFEDGDDPLVAMPGSGGEGGSPTTDQAIEPTVLTLPIKRTRSTPEPVASPAAADEPADDEQQLAGPVSEPLTAHPQRPRPVMTGEAVTGGPSAVEPQQPDHLVFGTWNYLPPKEASARGKYALVLTPQLGEGLDLAHGEVWSVLRPQMRAAGINLSQSILVEALLRLGLKHFDDDPSLQHLFELFPTDGRKGSSRAGEATK